MTAWLHIQNCRKGCYLSPLGVLPLPSRFTDRHHGNSCRFLPNHSSEISVPKLGQVWVCLLPIPRLNFKFPLAEHGAFEVSKAKAARISCMWKRGIFFFTEVINHFGHANSSSEGKAETGAHTFMGQPCFWLIKQPGLQKLLSEFGMAWIYFAVCVCVSHSPQLLMILKFSLVLFPFWSVCCVSLL